jgi:hypothetical protein
MRLAKQVVKGDLRLGGCAEVMPQTVRPRLASAIDPESPIAGRATLDSLTCPATAARHIRAAYTVWLARRAT